MQNGPRAVVVVGHPESLHTLSVLLNEKETRKEDNVDQSRVPHSKRKKEFRLVYLPVSVPFHSQLLKGAVQRVKDDVKRLREKGGRLWSLKGKDLAIPIYSTLDGSDLRTGANELVDTLIDLQCTEHVNWLRATEKISRRRAGITHVIDFGPGKMSGAVSFTSKNLEGSGVQFVMAGAFQPFEEDLVVADKSVLFDSRTEAIPFALDWETEFGPSLVQRKADGKLLVDTKYTRVMGKPPIMVAGMTPTTASHQVRRPLPSM
jgi:fatty acid synthase subunit beta